MLEGEGVDRRQFVGMQLPDGMFDSVVALVRRLEEHAVFLAVLDGTLPGVDALDPGNLRAGGEPGLDQRLRHGPRRLLAGHGRDDGDGLHFPPSFPWPSVRSAGTTTNCLSSLPAITERVVSAPMRSPLSRRTKSSAPVTRSPSSASTMLPGWSPALAAGLSGSRLAIATPCTCARPSAKARRRGSGTVWPATPMKARRTRP